MGIHKLSPEICGKWSKRKPKWKRHILQIVFFGSGHWDRVWGTRGLLWKEVERKDWGKRKVYLWFRTDKALASLVKGSGATVGLLCSVAGGRLPREGHSPRQSDCTWGRAWGSWQQEALCWPHFLQLSSTPFLERWPDDPSSYHNIFEACNCQFEKWPLCGHWLTLKCLPNRIMTQQYCFMNIENSILRKWFLPSKMNAYNDEIGLF